MVDEELEVMGEALLLLTRLDVPARKRVLQWLAARSTGEEQRSPGSASLEEFLAVKSPQTMIEAATCIAHWWEDEHQQPITAQELRRANLDSGLPVFSDAAATAENASRTRRWLERTGAPATWRVTAEGRAMVAALPDRALVVDKPAHA